MFNYKRFLLEKLSDSVLEYYMLDWDNNILNMSSIIHVDYFQDGKWIPKDLSSSEFAEIRTLIRKRNDEDQTGWGLRNNNYDDTFDSFRDNKNGISTFITDSLEAISKKSFGPVWNKFIKCIVDGNVFMIITARGHEPETIKYVVRWIIFNYITNKQRKILEKNLRKFNVMFDFDDSNLDFEQLIENYLEKCDFIGINSKFFKEKFGKTGKSTTAEHYKAIAIRYFTEKINNFGLRIGKKVKVGFSDDDSITIQHVYKYMKNELSLDFPIDYHVYHTKDGEIIEL